MHFSIRNLLGRGGGERREPGGDRRLAQKLVDRGIAAETSGAAAKAIDHFRKAVAADGTFATAHMNLGIALHAASEFDAAIASHERAIAADPGYAPAHYNLGLARSARAQSAEAESAFRAALKLRDDFPEAWVGLAGALEALGRNDDALAALERAIALRSDYAGALLNAITLQLRIGRLADAAENSRKLLTLEPENFLAHATLGLEHEVDGRLEDAEASFRRALVFNPEYTPAKAHLAMVLGTADRIPETIPLLFDVVAHDPANGQMRRNLAAALNDLVLQNASETERAVLRHLCTDDNVSMLFINPAIVNLLKQDEGFQILQTSAPQREDVLRAGIPAIAKFLRDPLLLASLPRMPLCDAALEEVLVHVRRCLILDHGQVPGGEGLPPGVGEEFVCALARQCFYANYAMFARDDELRHVEMRREALRDALREDTLRPSALEIPLAMTALYDPLHTLQGHERLLALPESVWSDAFRPILREQLENRVRERALARELVAITDIDDTVSRAVRAQYEENPYPRWVTMQCPNAGTIEVLAAGLCPGRKIRVRPRPMPILIAGCGTGHVPVLFAKSYPDGEILAVDLSLASMAYAARMTRQFGISNITYQQADILKLSQLGRRFALIECSGVLHHLDDPMAGWRVLTNLLESDGLMRIGLYSEKARAAVTAAREFARSLGFPSTADGIRRCRHAIGGLPDGHPARKVMTYGDFFTLDSCRDLIMHVQEHQFTLPRIEECLEQLGLQFLGMECTAATRKRFREKFPGGAADNSLGAWHQFEKAYPDTFLTMYSFWCQPRQDFRV